MVSPVLDQNKTELNVLFPPGSWYNMFDMTKVMVSKETHYLTLDAPLHVINVHLYENAIIPMQRGGLISKTSKNYAFYACSHLPTGGKSRRGEGESFLRRR